MDFSNMEVTIDHIADAGAKLKAYATVTFDGMFKVHGVRLAESKQGLNIFMPQKAFNKNGKTLYMDVFHPITSGAAHGAQGSSYRRLQKSDEIKKQEVPNEISRSLSAPALKVGVFYVQQGRSNSMTTTTPYRARDQPQSCFAPQFRKENSYAQI